MVDVVGLAGANRVRFLGALEDLGRCNSRYRAAAARSPPSLLLVDSIERKMEL